MFGLFKKKQQLPQVQYRFKEEEEKVYDLRIVMKRKDVEYSFLFNNFEVCAKIKENIVSEITRNARVINYIHEGKNAVVLSSLRTNGVDDRFLFPKSNGYFIHYPETISVATNLQAITFSVDDISTVRMKDKIVEVTKKVMHVRMTQDEFDKKVSDWHNSKTEENQTLSTYLGLTENEYTDIVENFIPKVWGSVPEKLEYYG
jgi:hypothetical protein